MTTQQPDEVPNAARIYDRWLGGSANNEADRQVADHIARVEPCAPVWARANRDFLRRAVSFLTEQGIDQFLDLGSGIPTVGNVHEVARQHDPKARVVYVDVEPVAVAYARQLLAGDPLTGVVHADLRDVAGVLAAEPVRELLDLSRPVAVLLVSVLHFIPESADPDRVIADYLAPMVPGSTLTISQVTSEGRQMSPRGAEAAESAYRRTATPIVERSTARIAELFAKAGTELVPPGLVSVGAWRPDADASDDVPIVGGVGVKR